MNIESLKRLTRADLFDLLASKLDKLLSIEKFGRDAIQAKEINREIELIKSALNLKIESEIRS